MKKRFIYSILFGLPGFIASVIASVVVFGSTAGVLWIFAFGDNPWPASIGIVFPILFALVFLTTWIVSIALGFVIGKRLERDPVLNKTHIGISLGLAIALLLFIVLYQVRVGNLGPRPEGLRCMDYCSQRGYPASSVSPQNADERTCGCFDDTGREVIRVPIGTVDERIAPS